MSLQAMVWAIEEVQDLDPSGKLLLIVLGNYAGSDWTCFPSQPTLAADTSMSTRSVGIWLSKLEARGLIHRTPRHTGSKARTSDLIRLRPPAEFSGGGGEGNAPPPRRGFGVPPVETAGEPSTEPPIEPRPSDEGLSPQRADRSDARIVFDSWNELSETHGWPKASKLTDARRGHINARIRDANGLDGFMDHLASIEFSDFLMGRVSGRRAPFVISLDFVLQAQSFTRLMEGFYHRNRGGNVAGAATDSFDPTSARNHQRTSAMFSGARLNAERSAS